MTFPLGQSVCTSWAGAGSSFCLLLTLIKLHLQRRAGRLCLPGSVTRFSADLKSPRAVASQGQGSWVTSTQHVQRGLARSQCPEACTGS